MLAAGVAMFVRLVDEIDRLVRQEPIGDVAARLVDRKDQEANARESLQSRLKEKGSGITAWETRSTRYLGC